MTTPMTRLDWYKFFMASTPIADTPGTEETELARRMFATAAERRSKTVSVLLDLLAQSLQAAHGFGTTLRLPFHQLMMQIRLAHPIHSS